MAIKIKSDKHKVKPKKNVYKRLADIENKIKYHEELLKQIEKKLNIKGGK